VGSTRTGLDNLDHVLIRLATLADAEAIRAIYNREILSPATFDIVPRSPEEQQTWLAEHAGAYPAIVATSGNSVLGFGSLSRYRGRPAYSTTVEDSVYVDSERRKQGVGRGLLAELTRLATAHGFHTVVGRVVGDNAASIALHRSCGFELVGMEREVGRKLGRWLDVAVLQRML
jgi:phosphinothricin acetyltransferase